MKIYVILLSVTLCQMLSCDFWRRMQVNGNYLIGPTLVGQQLPVTVTSQRQWQWMAELAVDLSYYSVDCRQLKEINEYLRIQIFT